MTTEASRRGFAPRPALERLLLKTDISPDGCWSWRGSDNGRGYGVIGLPDPRRSAYVHRVMYEIAKGPIVDGYEVAHTCDVRNCVRPTHLVLMTHAGNVADMVSKGRSSRGASRSNTRLTEDGVRAIRSRVAAGERRAVVAAEFGVSVAAVDLIVTRKRWVYLE
jgi:hypothetical protein